MDWILGLGVNLNTFQMVVIFQLTLWKPTKIISTYLLVIPPSISVSSIVRKLKQKSTVDIWKHFHTIMRLEFWKENTFWSDGYFACSIGEASPETIRKYIENQG
jgi:hypothetical protein